MKISSATADKARWMMDFEGTWVCFRVPSPAIAKEICENFVVGKVYNLFLKLKTKSRSLDANAYFWVLVGKLAAALRVKPDEIYRQYVPDVGDNFEVVPIKEEHIEDWDRMWCAGHTGRITDDLGECRNIPGYHYIRCYFGQSDYDTAQMSRLIDMVVQDCKAQGIETMTPEELRKLVDEWR
jgi:hypothetical protein